MSKPKVGFFDLASCEGCQVELTNFGDEVFMELLKHIDIVEFREVMSEKTDFLDIAFIEGSATRSADKEKLEDIRKRSKVVVAYGACAATGGINALKNHQTDYREYVYGPSAHMKHLESLDAKPVSSVIKVDYSLHGCPMDRNEFLNLVSDLIHGREPFVPNYPVCMECKRRETVCRYERGDHCMGIVARAGCNAICPAHGIPCEACRGVVDHANFDSLERVLVEKGKLTPERAKTKYQMFASNCKKHQG